MDAISNAWKDTTGGMREEIARVEDRVSALESYQKALLSQGERSFGIRVRTGLTTKNLSNAMDDVKGGVRATGEWLTGGGENHIGTFLAERWWAVLVLILAAVGAWFGIRKGRVALDNSIRAAAAKEPRLAQGGVSVAAEAAVAQELKDQAEAAMREAEKQALSDATKEASDDSPEEDTEGDGDDDADDEKKKQDAAALDDGEAN